MSVWIYVSVWISLQRDLKGGTIRISGPRDAPGRNIMGRQPPAKEPGVYCSPPFKLCSHQAAADWAQWDMEAMLSSLWPVITGGLCSGIPHHRSQDFVRLALQGNAFSVLLFSSPLWQVSNGHGGHTLHLPSPTRPLTPLCSIAVFLHVSSAHPAPCHLLLKDLN